MYLKYLENSHTSRHSGTSAQSHYHQILAVFYDRGRVIVIIISMVAILLLKAGDHDEWFNPQAFVQCHTHFTNIHTHARLILVGLPPPTPPFTHGRVAYLLASTLLLRCASVAVAIFCFTCGSVRFTAPSRNSAVSVGEVNGSMAYPAMVDDG